MSEITAAVAGAIAGAVTSFVLDIVRNKRVEMHDGIKTYKLKLAREEEIDLFEKVTSDEISRNEQNNLQNINMKITSNFTGKNRECGMTLTVAEAGKISKIGENGFAMICIRCGRFSDWKSYQDAGYALSFHVQFEGNIKGAWLEFKNRESGNSPFQYCLLHNNKTENIFLKQLSAESKEWKNMTQICFTVFSKDYEGDGDYGRLTITDLKLTKKT